MKVFVFCLTTVFAQETNQTDLIYDLDHVYDDNADYDGMELIMPKKLNQTEEPGRVYYQKNLTSNLRFGSY